MNARRVYMNPDDRPRFQEEVERKGFVRDFEIAYRARDGRRLDCLVTTTVRRDTDGIVIGYQGIIRERKGMEERLYAHHQKLRSLAVGLSTSAERERFRIAADLHDCIGQMLAASQLKVKALRRAGDREREALIAELKELIDQMDCDIRSMTFDLSSPVLYQLGLVPGLEWLGEQVKRQYGLMVDLATEGDCEVLDQDMRFLMFRCIRELLLNVAQHADVDRATVSLRRDEAQLQAMQAGALTPGVWTAWTAVLVSACSVFKSIWPILVVISRSSQRRGRVRVACWRFRFRPLSRRAILNDEGLIGRRSRDCAPRGALAA